MDAKKTTVRRITLPDLAIVEPWYVARDGAMPRHDLLPMDSGFMFYLNDKPIGVGFLLMTNSKMAIMEWLQTDHTMPIAQQSRMLRHMAIFLEGLAKGLGFTVIMGFVPADHTSLAKFYVRQGAQLAKKASILVYKLLGSGS